MDAARRDPRIEILEELRTADRLVASAIATLRYARRQQGFDMVGLPTTEGMFDTQTQRDNATATSDMLEAEGALRRVEKRVALPPTTADIQVAHWSLWTDLAGGVFDLIPLAKLASNLEAANGLQAGIRSLFGRLHAADPQLFASVEPLANWDDGPSEIGTAWQYNRGPMIIAGLCMAGFAIATMVSMFS